MGTVMKMAGALTLLFCSACCDMGSSEVKPAAESRNATGANTPDTKSTTNSNANTGKANPGGNDKGYVVNAPAQPTRAAQGPVATPAQQTYPMDGIKTIPDDCGRAEILLATAPKSVGLDYQWHVTRQALLANQQFKFIFDRPPSNPGEIYIGVWGYNDGYALVVNCGDGATCNRFAAMYKAIVRSSHAQVLCKTPIQGISANQVNMFNWNAENPKANLPKDGDLQAQCARINACMLASEQSTPGDPFLECQKAPAKFKTDCAKRYPCAEVIACMGK